MAMIDVESRKMEDESVFWYLCYNDIAVLVLQYKECTIYLSRNGIPSTDFHD